MRKKIVTVGLVQMQMSENQDMNLAKAQRLVERAAKKGAKIICLPELYRSIYFPQYKRADTHAYAEPIPGPTTHAFSPIAKKYGVVIIVPVFERTRRSQLYNSAVVIDDRGRILPTYRKVHIPHDPHFYERNYFERGTQYNIYRTRFARLAVLICYDQWFPEAARIVALNGAEIIFYPTAIGRIVPPMEKDDDWADAWETVMRGHSISNAVHVAAVNRIGRERRLHFWGRSFVADSFGAVLKRASENREEVLVQKIDLDRNEAIRRRWMFFDNRRPDTYLRIAKKPQ